MINYVNLCYRLNILPLTNKDNVLDVTYVTSSYILVYTIVKN